MNTRSNFFTLGFIKNSVNDKAMFTLNGSLFYPITYLVNYRNVNSDFIKTIRSLGCNSINLAVDISDVDKQEVKDVLALCYEEKMPTFMEINENEFWQFLQKNISLNMIMYNQEPVKHFPDYANPETRKQHLDRYKRAAILLKKYAHKPIIGVSVGAYDAYHLPDGETHLLFNVPKHQQEFETYVPYGEWAKKEFIKFLTEQKVLPENLALNSLSEIDKLPTSLENSTNFEMWHQWMLFRRHIVKKWLAETIQTVKEEIDLPVTVTYDLVFSLMEDNATPHFNWTDVVDFIIVYYFTYKQGVLQSPSLFIPLLLRTVYKEYNDMGKPMIALMEFTSANTSGTDFARESAPFVSGMMTTAPECEIKEYDFQKRSRESHNKNRVESFIKWNKEHSTVLTKVKPEDTDVLILIDKDAIFFKNPYDEILSMNQIPYDIKYLSVQDRKINLGKFKYILIPKNFSSGLVSKLDKTRNLIFEDKAVDILNILNQST